MPCLSHLPPEALHEEFTQFMEALGNWLGAPTRAVRTSSTEFPALFFLNEYVPNPKMSKVIEHGLARYTGRNIGSWISNKVDDVDNIRHSSVSACVPTNLAWKCWEMNNGEIIEFRVLDGEKRTVPNHDYGVVFSHEKSYKIGTLHSTLDIKLAGLRDFHKTFHRKLVQEYFLSYDLFSTNCNTFAQAVIWKIQEADGMLTNLMNELPTDKVLALQDVTQKKDFAEMDKIGVIFGSLNLFPRFLLSC